MLTDVDIWITRLYNTIKICSINTKWCSPYLSIWMSVGAMPFMFLGNQERG